MTNLHRNTLEWAAQWVEDSLRAETNERTVEFGKNVAMTLRAATSDCATAAPDAAAKPLREQILQPNSCGVSGHFTFQNNGGNCLMCQREHVERERIRQLVVARVRNFDGDYGDGDGLRTLDRRGLEVLAAEIETMPLTEGGEDVK